MTTGAGFLFAGFRDFDFVSFIGVIVGTALVIGAGCVFNNIIDRHIDAKMERTAKRALVTGDISVTDAKTYGLSLLVLGFLILMFSTNILTVGIGIIGFIDYVFVYGFFKRRSTLGTLVGSICGATPVIAGYSAAAGQFDTGALLLFLIMVFWQMPHFYSIAIYRGDDYASASLPVLPVVRGARKAKVHIFAYTILFIAANILLYMSGYASVTYLAVLLAAGLWWLQWAVAGFRATDNKAWARKMFGYSLIVLLIFSFMLSVNYWLP